MKERLKEQLKEAAASAEFDDEKVWELIEKLEPLLANGDPECLNFIDSLVLIPGSGNVIRLMDDFYFHDALYFLLELKEQHLAKRLNKFH